MGQNVGSIFELTVEYQAFGEKALNILHYRVDVESSIGSVVDETLDVLAAFLEAGSAAEAILELLPTNVSMTEVHGQFIRGTGGQRFARQSVPGLGAGGISSPCSTFNVAAVLTKKTAQAGRWAIGSIHIPGLPTNAYGDGMLTDAGYVASMQDLADELIEPLVGVTGAGEYIPVIAHPVGEHGGSTEILRYDVQTEVRTQRTRTVGKGI